MYLIFLNSLFLILLLVPISSNAMPSRKDADLIISIKHGDPCFSYPQDKEVQNNRYAIVSHGVSECIDKDVLWEIVRKGYDNSKIIEPNSVDTCIEYGALIPGMRVEHGPKTLQFDVPYRANIHLREASGVGVAYKRDYLSQFCIARNEKGETVIVKATGGGRGEWRCLKPGESSKSGFWGWLFGQ